MQCKVACAPAQWWCLSQPHAPRAAVLLNCFTCCRTVLQVPEDLRGRMYGDLLKEMDELPPLYVR